jgi:hypothetical protein
VGQMCQKLEIPVKYFQRLTLSGRHEINRGQLRYKAAGRA